MDARTQARLEARARILKALAHPARLLIIEELGKQERCVAELTQMVGSDMSTVSKHLALLKAVGLLVDHKRGTQVFYRLAAPCALGFFTCLESVMEANLQTHLQLARPLKKGIVSMSDSRIVGVGGQNVGIIGLDQALESLDPSWDQRSQEDVGQALYKMLSANNYMPASAQKQYEQALGREYRRQRGLPVQEDEPRGLVIKVLGPGCSRCESLTASVMNVLEELKLAADLEHVRDMMEIARFGVMGTPALVVNGKVVSVGSVPSPSQIKGWLQAAS